MSVKGNKLTELQALMEEAKKMGCYTWQEFLDFMARRGH